MLIKNLFKKFIYIYKKNDKNLYKNFYSKNIRKYFKVFLRTRY